MRYALRDYQDAGVRYAIDFMRQAGFNQRLLLAAPTGSGKSVMELAIQAPFDNAWIITPKVEIVEGLITKLGHQAPSSEAALMDLARGLRISTPTRLRNLLLAGAIKPPSHLIVDESHHDAANTYQQLHLLAGLAPAVGLTASPFRGTPRSTREFLEHWGQPVWVITFREAVALGHISMPACSTVPLIDDETLELSAGDFAVRAVTGAYADKLEHASKLVEWPLTQSTMYSVPSRELAHALVRKMNSLGLMAFAVTGETSFADRREAFDLCLRKALVLVQIQVVGEGVDLPIERLVDMAPTLSPVLWLQKFGRITRPGLSPRYIATNRNLLRHAYLLDGMVPPYSMKEAQDAYKGELGRRDTARVVGIESLGRIKPISLPLASGLAAAMYAIQDPSGREFCAIMHPNHPDVLWATRQNVADPETNEKRYGRWERCEPPAELVGFNSVQPSQLSDAQRSWWKKSAARHGLDPNAEINRKQFVALPVLSNLGGRL
jgi:hypothetical protein